MDRPPTERPGPCDRCGAERWEVRRPGLWSGTTRWLRSGGAWRRPRLVCRSCGALGPSTGWLVRWDDAPRPRVTLPARVVRELLRTVARERTAVPVPWSYLASSAAGSAVGLGAAVVVRSGRPVSASAVGAASGALACWSVFAWTAFRGPSIWSELSAAALQEVSPQRAAARRAVREHALARTATQVYGLAGWQGSRTLAGTSSNGVPPQVTSVTLLHGDPAGAAPWVMVETGLGLGQEDLLEAALADALWDDSTRPGDPEVGALSDDELLAHLAARHRERAVRPAAQWHDGTLVVDGHPEPARWAADGDHWVALAALDGLSLSVRAHQVPRKDVGLVVVDLADYTAWSG